MRGHGWGLVVLGLVAVVAGGVRADEQAEMRALVGKAIKAAGGRDKLAKTSAATVKGKGTVSVNGMEIALTFDLSLQDLHQAKLEMQAEVNGNNETFILVIDGGQGWIKGKDRIEKAPRDLLDIFRPNLYVLRLAQRLTPLLDRDVTLSPLGEIKVGDRPAVGLKVTRKGQADVSLFLDKKTLLPVKCEFQVKEMKDGQEIGYEYLFDTPKELDGIKHFSKLTFNRDGKKMFEMELGEVKAQEKLDAATFAKPE